MYQLSFIEDWKIDKTEVWICVNLPKLDGNNDHLLYYKPFTNKQHIVIFKRFYINVVKMSLATKSTDIELDLHSRKTWLVFSAIINFTNISSKYIVFLIVLIFKWYNSHYWQWIENRNIYVLCLWKFCQQCDTMKYSRDVLLYFYMINLDVDGVHKFLLNPLISFQNFCVFNQNLLERMKSMNFHHL